MEILRLSQKNQKEILEKTTGFLKQGKVVVCPTDTVYGLIADATNKKAVERVFKIKKRKIQKPIPIFVKDLKQAKKIAKINKNQEKFLNSIWPGKVTVILRPKSKPSPGQRSWAGFPKGIGKPKQEIGLRIPNYKIINQLLSIINLPLTGTSANISGKPPSTKIKEVLKQFGYNYSHGRIRISRAKGERALFACPDLVIDAGNLLKSKPSTVIDLTTSPPKILRE